MHLQRKGWCQCRKGPRICEAKPTPCPQEEEQPHGSPLRAVPCSSLTVPWQRHSWWVWQPTLALALLPPSSIQPPLVAILLHDEWLSNCSTTDLMWLDPNGLHTAREIRQHLCPHGPAGEGDVSPSPFLPRPSRQHL